MPVDLFLAVEEGGRVRAAAANEAGFYFAVDVWCFTRQTIKFVFVHAGFCVYILGFT